MKGMKHEAKGHMTSGHMMHTAMFKKRFFVCLALTIPVLLLSEAIQIWFQFTISIPYQAYILLILAVIIYAYGGWPFLQGLVHELRMRRVRPCKRGVVTMPNCGAPSMTKIVAPDDEIGPPASCRHAAKESG